MDLIRKRLIETLDSALKKNKVVFLIAPIGYGKTTLAKQYFSENKAIYFDNTLYQEIENEEEYFKYIDSISRKCGGHNFNWERDTVKIGEILKNKYEYSFHDNIERIKYKPLFAERSNIYLQEKNFIKTIAISRGRTFIKLDEMVNKAVTEVFDKNALAFTKEEVIKYAEINNIAFTDSDIRYCLKELKGVPLFVSMYFNGGKNRCYKPYLAVYKSTFYDMFSAKEKEIIQILAMFKTFNAQDIVAIYENQNEVDKIIELGYKYEGFIEFNVVSEKYELDCFLQELVLGLLEQKVIEQYSSKILEWKIKAKDFTQALSLAITCDDKEKILQLYNNANFTLEHPSKYENFDEYIKSFNNNEKFLYPYSYIKFAFSKLFNGNDDNIKNEFLAYYNKLNEDDKANDELIINCQLVMVLTGLIGVKEFIEKFKDRKFAPSSIKIVNIKRLFRHNYILMSLRSYAPISELKNFYQNYICNFQKIFEIPQDMFNQLYEAEYNIVVGNFQLAKEQLTILVVKADMAQNHELAVRGRTMLAKANYFCKQSDKLQSCINEIEFIGSKNVLPNQTIFLASKYIKQFLGRLNGFMLTIENNANNNILKNYGSFYVKQYIMKCLIYENRLEDLNLFIKILSDKSSENVVKSDESLLLLYESIMNKLLGETEKAIAAMIKCINIMAIDSVVDIIVEESKNVISLLILIEKKYLDNIFDKQYFNKIIALCQDFAVWQNIQSNKLLSEREFEILNLMGKNLKRNQIAERLYLSPETVKKYMQSIYKKLGVNDYTQAIIEAKNSNLI